GNDKNAIILDFFAGSGTTAHAVLELNKQDGGNRKFIICEQMDYIETVTKERIRKIEPKNIDNSKQEFTELSFTDQQKFLISLLDKNLLYVPYCDMKDKSYGISEKSVAIAILTTFALLIVAIAVLWNKFNKEKNKKEISEGKNKKLEEVLQEKENENKALKKEMCQECKKIYTYAHPESLSLSEDFDKCFSLVDEISDKEGVIYYQDEYIFVDFSLG
ncbi:5005_t:CDS:2, partial [Racocetra persica]